MDVSERIVVLNYSRAPSALRDVLENGTELQQARDALAQAGFSYILEPSQAKIFVQPNDYKVACVDLYYRSDIKLDIKLRSSTVVVSERYRPALDACVNPLKSGKRHNIRLKKTTELYPSDESS